MEENNEEKVDIVNVNQNNEEDKFEIEKEVKIKGNKKKIIIVSIIILTILIMIGGFLFYKHITQKGRIEFILVDQKDLPVIGAKVELKNANGKNIGSVNSGADGKINYYNVRAGDYILEIVEMPEGYEIEEKSKIVNISVIDNSTTYVKMTGKRNIGYLKVVVTDELDNLMEGVEVIISNIYGEFITSKETNEDGAIYHSFVEDGMYYFNLSINQEIASRYQLDTTLYRITVDDENKTFIKELKIKKDDIENVIAEEYKDTINKENVVMDNKN